MERSHLQPVMHTESTTMRKPSASLTLAVTLSLIVAAHFVPAHLISAQLYALDKSDGETEGDAQNGEQAKEELSTYKVGQEPLKIEIQLSGVFESSRTENISLATDAWGDLTISWAAEHGQRVKPGTPLIRCDLRKIDVAIEDLEAELAASRLALKQGDAALELLTRSVPNDLAAARRAAAEAAENVRRYEKMDRLASIKDVEHNVTSTRNSLEYQKEELRQLEKMYKADNLTEETEEIILTRTRNNVKAYEHMLNNVVAEQQRFLDITLPRREADLRQQQEAASLALKQADATLPTSLAEKQLAQEKMRISLRRSTDRLARMRRDRESMSVLAPVAGTVYYGKAVRGKWPDAATMQNDLAPGMAVKPNQVLMTIVDNDDLFVRTTVEEKQLLDLQNGAKATVTPTAFPAHNLSGKLRQVSRIPIASGKFDVVIDLAGKGETKRLAAGMSCEARFVAYQRDKAMLVPKSAVSADADGKKRYVQMVGADGKQKKRPVRVGRIVDDRLEILSGIEPGDTILRQFAD